MTPPYVLYNSRGELRAVYDDDNVPSAGHGDLRKIGVRWAQVLRRRLQTQTAAREIAAEDRADARRSKGHRNLAGVVRHTSK